MEGGGQQQVLPLNPKPLPVLWSAPAKGLMQIKVDPPGLPGLETENRCSLTPRIPLTASVVPPDTVAAISAQLYHGMAGKNRIVL